MTEATPPSSPLAANPAQARQTRQQFATPDEYLSYELGKAVQALPPLYTRLLAGGLTAIVVSAIAWAHFSKVDEVAVAQGELTPAEQLRPVQALRGGQIVEIHVQEGDRVEQGEVLIEQDAAISEADVVRLQETTELIRQDMARLEPELTGGISTGTPIQDQLLAARLQEFATQQSAAQSEVAQQESAIVAATARLTRLEANLRNARSTLANAEEREASLRELAAPENGAVPRFDYLEARDGLIQAQNQVASLEQEIAEQQAQIRQAEAAYRQSAEISTRIDSERRTEILTQLNRRREELANIEGQLEQATRQQEQETIRSPIDGVVYNLQISRAEGTVQPGEELLSILPDGEDLVLEVQILNRDIGFISPGMRAKVKMATFPFQEFGIIDGEVMRVSPNATTDEELGLVYPALVRLDRTTVPVRGQEVELLPGMAATAEIVTRQRSILTFLLEPVTRRFDEAFSTR
jgi:HlyD family secretion protein